MSQFASSLRVFFSSSPALTLTVVAPPLVSDPKADYIGTEPWKPKEALEEGGQITDKADIFAFGLTLWEMMTLAMPHLEMIDFSQDEEGEAARKSKDDQSGP